MNIKHVLLDKSLILLTTVLCSTALLIGCDQEEAIDLDAEADADAAAESLPAPPQLSPEELAARTAEATIAALPVGDAGHVTIVGPPDGSILAYLVAGGAANEVLRQLVDEQQASPAEVFLALAEPGVAPPEVLLADHRARASRDPQVQPKPRQLTYVLPRSLDLENLECYNGSGGAISFNSWVSDWTNLFNFINFTVPYRITDLNQDDGATGYSVGADGQGSVMSACNAAWNDVGVGYWAMIPNSPITFQFLAATTLNEFDAVHLYFDGYPFPLYMQVSHTHPDPNTYVAAGRCGGGC